MWLSLVSIYCCKHAINYLISSHSSLNDLPLFQQHQSHQMPWWWWLYWYEVTVTSTRRMVRVTRMCIDGLTSIPTAEVHVCHRVPAVCVRVEDLHALPDQRTIMTPHSIKQAIQHTHTCTTTTTYSNAPTQWHKNPMAAVILQHLCLKHQLFLKPKKGIRF